MTERLNGHQVMDQNAAEQIAAVEAAAKAARVATVEEARAMNTQINEGQVWADKLDAIEERRNSTEVRAMNDAADVAIFGSRDHAPLAVSGHIEGYVDPTNLQKLKVRQVTVKKSGKIEAKTVKVERPAPIDAPILGKVGQILDKAGIADMRENRIHGTKEADRKAKADAHEANNKQKAKEYVQSVEELREEGFELSQALVLMDLREERQAKQQSLFDKLRAQHEAAGMPSDEAVNKAAERVANVTLKQGNDEALAKRVIREEGLFDRSEYNKFRFKQGKEKNGERQKFIAYKERSIGEANAKASQQDRTSIEADLATRKLAKQQVIDAKNGPTRIDPAVAAKERADARKAQEKARDIEDLKYFVEARDNAHDKYARVSAGRGRRFGLDKEFSKKAVAEARRQYEAQKNGLIRHEKRMAIAAGVDPELLDKCAPLFAIGDAKKLAVKVTDERLLATGSFVRNPAGGVKIIEAKTPVGRMAERFYKWWGKQADAKFFSAATLKKSAAMAVPGAAIGVPAALAGSVLLGPIAAGAFGAFAATKIAKGVMAFHVNKRGTDAYRSDKLHNDLMRNINNNNNQAHKIGDVIDEQANNEVKSNRLRVVGAAAVAALGAAGGELYGHFIGNNLSSGGGSSTQGGSGSGAAESATATGGNTPPTQPTGSGNGNGGNGGQGGRGGNGGGAHKDPSFRLKEGVPGGDTVSGEVAQYLDSHGYEVNQANIDKVTGSTLSANGESWGSAYDLHPGDRFTIPHEILEQIGKKQ